MISTHLATGTRKGYDQKWDKWELLCRLRDQQPWLEFSSRHELRVSENQVLDFLVYPNVNMSRAHSTISGFIHAIKKRHEE